MKLIDADRLLSEHMKSKYYHLSNGDTAIPIIDIEHAPSINIIFCKDCKNADFSGTGINRCYCMEHGIYMYVDDFCSMGKIDESLESSWDNVTVEDWFNAHHMLDANTLQVDCAWK